MLTSIGDLAQSHFLRRQMTTVKSEMDNLTQQVSTGKATDIGAHLRGDHSALAGLDASLARLGAYGSVTATLSLWADAQQSALDRIDATATGASTALLGAGYADDTSLRTAGGHALDALETTLSLLNLNHADRSLFAGVAVGNGAIAGVDAIMASVRGAIGGADTAAAVNTAVQDWLDDPAGFGTLYQGGDASPAVAIAAGETVALDITAEHPSIKATLKGLILGALLAGDVLPDNRGERAALARQAGEALATNATDRAALMGQLGLTQQRLADAETRNSAEQTALGIARNELVAIDPYDAATRLQDAETRLETLYALTARLSRLSLAEYL